MKMKKPSVFIFLAIATPFIFSQCDPDEVEPKPRLQARVSVIKGYHTWQAIDVSIEYEGGKAIGSHGIVFSSHNNPTLEDGTVVDRGVMEYPNFYFELDGSTPFEPNQDYYAKAFAVINKKTYYSDVVEFHTFKGTWKKLASFPGQHRKLSLSFSVNGNLYVVGGTSMELTKFNDVWRYDPSSDAWLQKSSFPVAVVSTIEAASFVINDIAYVVSAAGLWRYHPENDVWEKLGDGINQTHMLAFTIDDKGYAGLGRWNGGLKAYNPLLNTWSNVPTYYPGEADHLKYTVSAGGRAFSGYGTSSTFGNESPQVEFYSFNPSTRQWTEQDSYLYWNDPKTGLVCFSINNKVYMGMGRNTNDAVFGDLNEFDPATGEWTYVLSMPGTERTDAIYCSANEKGYVGLGFKYHSGGQVDKLFDFWEFRP
jgi:N-acetylneuraminic acid mutarotase